MRIKLFGILVSFFFGIVLSSKAAYAGDFEEGAKLYSEKQYPKALPLLQKAARFSPMSWKTHYYLANTNLALGRMAQAKYEYELCIKTNPNAEIVARCKEGIARVDKYSNQTKRTGTTGNTESSESSEDGEGAKAPLTDAQVQAQRRKEDIMKLAREECAKVKQEANEQLQHEKANANQYYQDHDGRIFTDISEEREAEIHRETEEKCRKIMMEAEKRARSFD